MRQAGAIVLDAYRELNAKKLFWITLGLSGLVVAIFGIVGVYPEGMTVLWFKIPSPVFNSLVFPPSLFYKQMFLTLGVGIWLTWAAMILAIASTASLMPDFVASGSIELSLSKPISRAGLYLWKYLSGLLFVALQVLVFSVASFVVIGARSGTWEPRIFLAIPIVVAVFSFLYCILTLLGLTTRSTIASLLLTLLVWFCVFLMHGADQSLAFFREMNAVRQEEYHKRIDRLETSARTALEKEKAAGAITPSRDPATGLTPIQVSTLDRYRTNLDRSVRQGKTLRMWHRVVLGFKLVLPKTSETTQLLQRSLLSKEDLDKLGGPREDERVMIENGDDIPIDQAEVATRVQEKHQRRPLWWVLGTSLAFEAVIVGISMWIFARRDF